MLPRFYLIGVVLVVFLQAGMWKTAPWDHRAERRGQTSCLGAAVKHEICRNECCSSGLGKKAAGSVAGGLWSKHNHPQYGTFS